MRCRLVLLAFLAFSAAAPIQVVDADVGRTAGSFDASSAGGATYSIPIKLPAGPRGLQPNLAIKYDSQSGDGTMGPGWYLSGLGSITRCDKTYAQDSAAAAVSLVATDGYCLNSSRMRLISGSYGTAGSTYQTELADFSYITAYGSAGNGPGYFSVQGKDGQIYEYGNTNDGGSTYPARITASGTSTPYQWRLNKVRDRAGNNYIVTYGTGQSGSVGVGVPLSISYVPSGAGSSSYDYSIVFAYGVDTAGGTESGYVAGGSKVNNNRLTSITIQRGVTVIHRYNLGYELTTVTNRYRMNSVTECPGAAIDTTCLSPTVITYQNGAAGVSATSNTALSSTTSVKGAYDFNGDGRQDILYVAGTTLYVTFAYAGGFGTPVSTGITLASGDVYDVGDLLASGKDDLLVTSGGYWYRYYWTGTSFVGVSTSLPIDSEGAKSVQLADINGDGLQDLLTISNDGIHIFSRLNVSSVGAAAFSATRGTIASLAGCPGSNCRNQAFLTTRSTVTAEKKLDFNGDGRDDVVVTRTSYMQAAIGGPRTVTTYVMMLGGESSFTASRVIGDSKPVSFVQWNDDQCTDVISATWVSMSACNGNAGYSITYSGAFVGNMDWNGDRRTDLLISSNGYVGVYLSTGTGLGSLTTTSIPISGNALIFDQNGDGLDDLSFIGTSSPYAVTYRLHEGSGTPPDLVTSITDGYGVSYSPTYISIVQGSYTKATNATYPVKDIQDARYVVSHVAISDGVGGSYTQSYAYVGARQDVQGRGFMGFQSITVTDSRGEARKVKTYYKTAFPYGGMVYQRDVFQNNGTTLISRTVNTPSVINLDTTAYNQRYFPYVWSSTTDNYEVGGVKNSQWITSTTTSFNYDNYGNVTSRTSVVTDKDGTAPQSPTYNQTWTQVTTHTFTPDTGNWCVGLPTQTTEQYYATGALSVTRTASFTPDYVNCRVTQQVIEPSSSIYKVTADYGYGAFGNVSSIAITGKKPGGTDMATRTTTINWDTTGQFPISTTNPEGHFTQAGYNYNLGVQTSQTDPNGLVTGWTYDTLGRKLTETRPDGTSTTWSYNDCTSVSAGCQNGDPFSGSTGINKMVVIATDKDSGGAAIQDTWAYLDQFERTLVTKSKTLSGGYSRVGVQYNALGQLYRQTAPCEASSCAVYWTTNTYDALGRVTASSHPVSASNSTLQTTTVAYQGMTTVTTDPQNKSKTQVTDPKGGLRTSMDHDGYSQSFTYDAFGSLKTVTDSSANPLFSANYAYGVKAFQIQTADMDLGTWNYTLNALGEVTTYTDANGSVFTMTYDKLSRLLTRSVSGEGTATWTWGSSAGSYNLGQLQSMTSTNSMTESYLYDNRGRLSQKDIIADGTLYSYNYAYNTLGKLDTMTYPTSTSNYRLALKYLYTNGVLQQVKDNAAGTVFWQANAANANGQIVQQTLGNGIVTNHNYDAVTGLLNAIQSGVGGGTGIQNESYLWDKAGNLTQRQNNTLGLTESFYYDNLYRLDYSQLNGVTNVDLTYDALGRITNRSDVASNAAWTYHSTKKHAVTQAGSASYTYTYDNNGNAITRNGQSLTWSQYNYPKVINGSASESVTLSYDANNARWKQVYVNGGATETTLYLGKLMEKVVTSSTTDYRYYIHANGRAAVAVMSRLSTGTNTTRYVLEDHQDSPSKITDASGGVYVSESFTAYGARRNAATWSGAPTSTDLTNIANVSRQGYTWQTALGNMGLNHMNGRVQDAVTGRFLSADPYITDSKNTQNYNRYSYGYNNPLSYIDPSGFELVITIEHDRCDYDPKFPECQKPPAFPGSCLSGSCGSGRPTGPGGGSKPVDGSGTAASSEESNTNSSERQSQKDDPCSSTGTFTEFLKQYGPEIVDRTMNIVGGAGQVALGAGICSGGPSCMGGALLAAHGASNIYEGVTGSSSILRDGYHAALGSAGDLAYSAFNISSSVYGLTRSVLQPGTWNLFRNISSDYVPAWKGMTGTELAVEAAGLANDAVGAGGSTGGCEK